MDLDPPAHYRPTHSTEYERSQIESQRKVGPNVLYRAIPAVQKLVLLLAASENNTPKGDQIYWQDIQLTTYKQLDVNHAIKIIS